MGARSVEVVVAAAIHCAESECRDEASTPVVTAGGAGKPGPVGPSDRTGEVLTFHLTLVNTQRGIIPPGRLDVVIEYGALARTQCAIDTASLHLHAHVESIVPTVETAPWPDGGGKDEKALKV